ncbi:hypothetical protein BR93DRAFT_971119 [Coniochaeta sp. PMI_546]|nr:hypothetical protein BR93DRAFT_971119 [Coniochaeta sp. PMI_546]
MEPHGQIRGLQEGRIYRRRPFDPPTNQWVPEKVAIPENGLRQNDESIASDRDALSEHITRQRGAIYAMIDNITTNLYSIYDSLKATNARMWDFLGPSALPGGGFSMPFPTTQEEITSMCYEEIVWYLRQLGEEPSPERYMTEQRLRGAVFAGRRPNGRRLQH